MLCAHTVKIGAYFMKWFSVVPLLLVVVLSCAGLSNKEVQLAPLMEGHERSQHEVYGTHYVITSSGEGASKAGQTMFEKGGNIYDAAAAITFAISVERPQSTGIGGGGFMLIRNPESKDGVEAVDFREMAPLKAKPDMFLKNGEVVPKKSLDGIYSVAVPGLVAGILEVHSKYGTLPLETILAPAIELAESGFLIYPHLANAIKERAEVLKKYPAAAKIFLDDKQQPLPVGQKLIQKDLGKVLREIAKKGKAGFYDGWVKKAILAENKRLGGILTDKDFPNYKVAWREPVSSEFLGYTVYSMPPPSSGGAHVVEILNILEKENLKAMGPHSASAVHLTASAMQRAFADRAKFLGDSDFVRVPLAGLTSKSYAEKLRTEIESQEGKALPSAKIKGGDLPLEPEETTHFSIMDSKGNMVASTQSVNWYLGSGVVVPGTGILLNDHMDDFAAKAGDANAFGAIGGNNNLIAPGKRPLSSMSPTLVLKGKTPVMTVGTPSGTRIISCVVLTTLNYLAYELPLYDSVAAIRYHHQWMPDEIRVDSPYFAEDVKKELESKGYKINQSDLGCKINAIALENGKIHGVADPRSEGLAIGN